MTGRFRARALLRTPVLAGAIAAVIILVLAFVPVFAITFGEPDGNAHPYVGSMVLRNPDWGVFQWCSGTLIAENVFLTASHCTFDVVEFIATRPGTEILVTFDPVIDEGGTFYTGRLVTNPNYNNFSGQYGTSDPGDVALIILDQSPGITPAQLPSAGLLDELKANGSLKNTRFTAVGYGSVRESKQKGWNGILDNLDRNRVDQDFLSLTKAWLSLSMNPSTGNGGACYGDSGGPHFIHRNGQETNIVVAVTVIGDSVCKATDKTYRVDTEAARSFLGNYVDLP